MSITVNGMTIPEIVAALNIRSGNKVANATGVGFVTISRIKRGHVTHPRYETLERLSRYILDNPEEVEVLRERLGREGV